MALSSARVIRGCRTFFNPSDSAFATAFTVVLAEDPSEYFVNILQLPRQVEGVLDLLAGNFIGDFRIRQH
jgi:hypothetical protein